MSVGQHGCGLGFGVQPDKRPPENAAIDVTLSVTFKVTYTMSRS